MLQKQEQPKMPKNRDRYVFVTARLIASAIAPAVKNSGQHFAER